MTVPSLAGLSPAPLLLVVDLQNDFLPGGALGVEGGDRIIPAINHYVHLFEDRRFPIAASRDWHPRETVHFRNYGGLWPPHCIQDTPGAAFHPDLFLPDNTVILSKGMNPGRDDYSAFQARTSSGVLLEEFLRAGGISRLYLCGLATDYCVRETSLDALGKGFSVTVLLDAVKGIDLTEGDCDRALSEIKAAGGFLSDLAKVEQELAAAE